MFGGKCNEKLVFMYAGNPHNLVMGGFPFIGKPSDDTTAIVLVGLTRY